MQFFPMEHMPADDSGPSTFGYTLDAYHPGRVITAVITLDSDYDRESMQTIGTEYANSLPDWELHIPTLAAPEDVPTVTSTIPTLS